LALLAGRPRKKRERHRLEDQAIALSFRGPQALR
jgi:hypothetical protein